MTAAQSSLEKVGVKLINPNQIEVSLLFYYNIANTPEILWKIDEGGFVKLQSEVRDALLNGKKVTINLPYNLSGGEHIFTVRGIDGNQVSERSVSLYNSMDYNLQAKTQVTQPLLMGMTSSMAQVYDPLNDNNFGVTTGKNSVTTVVLKRPVKLDSQISSSDRNQNSLSVEYYDNLGRPEQTVAAGASPSGADVVSFNVYDERGLESKKYLSYTVAGNNAAYKTGTITTQKTFYQGLYGITEPYAYSETKIENSPLQRPTEQSSPGEVWKMEGTHTVETEYGTNGTDVVKLFIDGTEPVENGYYLPGTLEKVTITDENGKKSVVYKDKTGNEILKQSYLGLEEVQTYYVYDKKNNLRFVIPPEAVKTGNYAAFRTKYVYDNENRLIEKYMPEESVVVTVYDKLGRVVLRQDGTMEKKNDWLFTKYDSRGRVVLTGIANFSTKHTREAMQNLVNSHTVFYENYTTTGALKGYTDNAFPKTGTNGCVSLDLWTINYYDDYNFNLANNELKSFNRPAGFADTEVSYDNKYTLTAFEKSERTNGMQTASLVKVFGESNAVVYDASEFPTGINQPLEGDKVYVKGEVTLMPGFYSKVNQTLEMGPAIIAPSDYLATVSFYDKYGRVIQSKTENHLGGMDISSTQYDFSGKVIKSHSTHSDGTDTRTVEKENKYDVAGNVIITYEKIDNQRTVQNAMTYNEIGQLVTKKLHSLDGGTNYFQELNYSYNARGWLKKVNNKDKDALGTDKFAYELFYEDNGLLGGPDRSQYNGNISAMAWNLYDQGNSNNPEAYSYKYDDLARLKEANYYLHNGTVYESKMHHLVDNISYDFNGNIKTLRRNGDTGALIDDLRYDYDNAKGNRLLKVTDTGIDTLLQGLDFQNGDDLAIEYEYDENGNMTRDYNKKIRSITYNYLNLPEILEFEDGKTINWKYTASGTKLRKEYFNGENRVTTDYVNGYIYKSETNKTRELEYLTHPEGRVTYDKELINGTNYEYEYHFKDHLGNTRVAYTENNAFVSEVFYYPFGIGYEVSQNKDIKYKYNGKEHANENFLNWYHYGVRFYDPALGRWHVIDPADQYNSAYMFVNNDPIRFLDPDGKEGHDYHEITIGIINWENKKARKYAVIGAFTGAAISPLILLAPEVGSLGMLGATKLGGWGMAKLGSGAVITGNFLARSSNRLKYLGSNLVNEVSRITEKVGLFVSPLYNSSIKYSQRFDVYLNSDRYGLPGFLRGGRTVLESYITEGAPPTAPESFTDFLISKGKDIWEALWNFGEDYGKVRVGAR